MSLLLQHTGNHIGFLYHFSLLHYYSEKFKQSFVNPHHKPVAIRNQNYAKQQPQKLDFNLFKAVGGHFDLEKLKKIMWVEPVKSIPVILLMVQQISKVLWKLKFIGITFEDFKKSLKELEQKSGVARH